MLYEEKIEYALNEYIKERGLECWMTVTFPNAVPPSLAKKEFQRFFKKLNKADEEFFKKYVECLVFIEKNKTREGVHIHAVVGKIAPTLYPRLKEKCKKYFGESEVKARDYRTVPYLVRKFDSELLEDWFPLKINSRYRGSKPTLNTINE